jgi:tetratricopeptide (TPR) repeat protein
MKYILSLFTVICSCAIVSAQQGGMLKGIVYIAQAGGLPAKGYQVKALSGNANTTFTDEYGKFELLFSDRETGEKVSFAIAQKNSNGSYTVVKNVETYLPKNDIVIVPLITAAAGMPGKAPVNRFADKFIQQLLDLSRENEKRKDSLDKVEKALTEKKKYIDSLLKNNRVSALGSDALQRLAATKNFDSALKVLNAVDIENEYNTFMKHKDEAQEAIKKTVETYKLKITLLSNATNGGYDSANTAQIIVCDKKLLSIYTENKFDTSEIISQYIVLAYRYNAMSQYTEALDYCLAGLRIAEASYKYQDSRVGCLMNCADYFLNLGDCANAVLYQQQSIALLQNIPPCADCNGGSPINEFAYDRLGEIYSSCKQYFQSLNAYQTALAFSKKGDYSWHFLYEKIARVYADIKEKSQAKLYLDSSIMRFDNGRAGSAAGKLLEYENRLTGWQTLNDSTIIKTYRDSIASLGKKDSLLTYPSLAPYLEKLKQQYAVVYTFLQSKNIDFSYSLLTESNRSESADYLAGLYTTIWQAYKSSPDSVQGLAFGNASDTLQVLKDNYTTAAKYYNDLAELYLSRGDIKKMLYYSKRKYTAHGYVFGETDSLTVGYLVSVAGDLEDISLYDTAIQYYTGAHDLYLKNLDFGNKERNGSIYCCERLIDLYEKKGKYADAIKFTKLKYKYRYGKEDFGEELFFEVAHLYFKAGNYALAVENWQKTVSYCLSPIDRRKLSRLYYDIALAYKEAGDYTNTSIFINKAALMYNQEKKKDGNYTEFIAAASTIYYSLASIYAGKKDYSKARGSYEKALIIDPGNSFIRQQFALLCIAQGQVTQALALVQKAVAINPDLTIYYYTSIIPGLIKLKQFDKAKLLLEKCESYDSLSSSSLLYHRTAFYAAQNQKAKALEYFAKYVAREGAGWQTDMAEYFLIDPLLANIKNEKAFVEICSKIGIDKRN